MRIGVSAGVVVALVGTAFADPPRLNPGEGQRATVERVRPAGAIPATAHYIYLNRCTGGCTINGGADDARAMTSSIAAPGAHTMTEFQNDAGPDRRRRPMPRGHALLTCVQEVYSPFGVTVSRRAADQRRVVHDGDRRR